VHRSLLLLCAAPALAATLAAAPNAGAANAPSAPTPPRADRAAANHATSDVGAAVDRAGAFAGIRLAEDHGAVEVYVTGRDPHLEASARAAAGDVPVRFTVVRHSYASLKALAARVDADVRWFEAQGVRVTHFGVKDSQNSVVVGVEDLTPAKAAVVARRYPNLPVTTMPGHMAVDASSRLDDSAPWNGGDLMSPDGEDNDCTVGPAVKNSSGHEYLLTAGHCFRLSGSSGYIYRVFQGSDQVSYDDPVLMGYAKAENPGSGVTGFDLGVIDPYAGASGLVWKTSYPTTVSTAKPQRGTFRAYENTDVCFSGGYSGQYCDGSITYFDWTYTQKDGGKVHHANLAYSAPSILAGVGDSGGPVYQQRTDGEIYIAGVILSMYSGGWPCPNSSFVYRGNQCDDEVWFGGIGSILNHTGTTLVVP
jgi:hypothetical protein